MKILKISALGFLIFGITHVSFIDLAHPRKSQVAFIQNVFAEDKDEDKEEEREYSRRKQSYNSEEDDRYYRPQSTPVAPRSSTTTTATSTPTQSCKTVYDTITSASGHISRTARKVCTPVTPEPPTTTTPVKPVSRDTVAPTIQVSIPQTNTHVPFDKTQIFIQGTVLDQQDPYPTIKIVTSSGSTRQSFGVVALQEGENTITITAQDASGNQSKKILMITRDSKPAPAPVPVTPPAPPAPQKTTPKSVLSAVKSVTSPTSTVAEGTGTYSYPGGQVLYTVHLEQTGSGISGSFINWENSPVLTQAQAETLLRQMIAAKTAQVDSITGATGSSQAIKQAFTQAWNKISTTHLSSSTAPSESSTLSSTNKEVINSQPSPPSPVKNKGTQGSLAISQANPLTTSLAVEVDQPISVPLTMDQPAGFSASSPGGVIAPSPVQTRALEREQMIAQYLAKLKIQALIAQKNTVTSSPQTPTPTQPTPKKQGFPRLDTKTKAS